VDEEIKRMSTAFESEQLSKIMQQLNTPNQEDHKDVEENFEQKKRTKEEKFAELDRELLGD